MMGTNNKRLSTDKSAKGVVGLISAGLTLLIETMVLDQKLKIGLLTLIGPIAIIVTGWVEHIALQASLTAPNRQLQKASTQELKRLRKALLDEHLTDVHREELRDEYYEAVKFDARLAKQQIIGK
jgi:hypothetical protein